MNNRTSIYEPIKNGYKFGSRKFDKNINGYQLDEQLSNKNHQVYFNKEKNDLLFNVNGTRPEIMDWKNNISLGLGYIGKYIPFVGGMKESEILFLCVAMQIKVINEQRLSIHASSNKDYFLAAGSAV